MPRLFLKIYATIIASLVLLVLIVGGLWRAQTGDARHHPAVEIVAQWAAAALPAGDAPPEVQRGALEELSHRLHADLALYGMNGELVATAGRPLPTPHADDASGDWIGDRHNPAFVFTLPDGRRLIARAPHDAHAPWSIFGFLLAGAIAVGLAALPVARGMTRRLEALQRAVETLGAGNLSARVAVTGNDEVANLASSFNRAAERIEELVGAHRALLANTSHELRTPLARIRLGIDLLKQDVDAKRKAELEQDIAELDQLIDEILTASRLDTVKDLGNKEEVDLLALAAEEGARFDNCTVGGTPALVSGDSRLLRRMIRNLLENARRHGAPPIDIEVSVHAGTVTLAITDHGPGIPDAEREKIFEPFYRIPGRSTAAGTGLGLSLVRQIARRHGGDAVVAPNGAIRAHIVVTLPAATAS